MHASQSRRFLWIGIAGTAVCTLVALGQSEPTPSGGQTPTSQPAGPPQERDTRPGPATAEDVMRAFELDRPKNMPIPPTEVHSNAARRGSTQGASFPNTRYPDGHILADRAGRLVRDGGWWVFTFEANSGKHEEPPMRLLPNRMLERAVFEVSGSPNIVFIISGEVTDFQGKNYLLLRKLLRRRDFGNIHR
jgi:hypothetical protein